MSVSWQRAAALAMSLLSIGFFCPACTSAPKSPGSIILIVVDTLRRDALGVYGSPTHTPNIDNLAAHGVAHSRLTASFHQTSMSMAALFTGRTPSLESGTLTRSLDWNGRTWCGLSRFAQPADHPSCIPESIETLGTLLRNAGYWTAGIVTNPLLFRPAGFDRGFHEWVELSLPKSRKTADGRVLYRRGGVTASAVNETVEQVLATRPSGRLFLYVHYMDVHDHMLTGIPYTRMVERVDVAIGGLIQSLAQQGLLEDSVILLIGDHGETLTERHWIQRGPGHRGNPTFGEQMAIPLIVSPATYAPPAHDLRSQDLFGFMARLAGTPLSNPADELRSGEIFLSELNWQTYQSGRFKSHRRRGTDRIHLVDLIEDPAEHFDVAIRHPKVVAAHAARLDELTSSLAASYRSPTRLTEEDERALRQLGYLE